MQKIVGQEAIILCLEIIAPVMVLDDHFDRLALFRDLVGAGVTLYIGDCGVL